MDSRARLRALLCLVVCVLAHVEAAPVRSNEHRSFIVTCWNSSDDESTVAALAAPRPALELRSTLLNVCKTVRYRDGQQQASLAHGD